MRESSDNRDRQVRQAPSVPPVAIERPALLDRLDGLLHRPLTWITGPAGAGKSVLVGQWCRQRCTLPVVWLELRSDETDPARLIDDVAGAVDESTGRVDRRDRRSIAELVARVPESVLVIDGVNTPASVQLCADLALAIERSVVHLVAVGRVLPPAEVVSLELRGMAAHIGAIDLRLDAAEVAAVIAAYSSQALPTEVAQRLTDRLDGWMAAAVLAGMAHRDGRDRSADELFDAAFDGIEAFVTSEILRAVSDETTEFLTSSAWMEELVPALCDLLTGRNDSERTLNALRSSGFPIERASRAGTFRCLGPVREVLEAQSLQLAPDSRAAGLRLAAGWYSQQQLPFEAADCWVRLGEWLEVVNVIVLHLHQILEADEMGRLARLVMAAPPAFMREQSPLALSGAWVLRMDGRIAAAYELLAVFQPYMTARGRMVADVVRSGVASWVEDVEGPAGFADDAIAACEELGEDAFKTLSTTLPPYTESTTDTYRTLAHSNALLACGYGGMWERGDAHLVDVAPDTAAGLPQLQVVQIRGSRATFLALAGRASEAASEAQAGLLIATGAGLLGHRSTADAYYAFGEALRLTLRHQEATDALERSRGLAELNGRRNLVAAIVASQAQLAVDEGKPGEALELIERLRAQSHHRPPKTVAGVLAAAEARAFAASGAHRQALRALEIAPSTPATATARIATLLATGGLGQVREVVQQWPAQPTVESAVRQFVAVAIASDVAGDRGTADKSFRSALTAAADHRLMQPFVEYGTLVIPLLQHADGGETGTTALDLARHVHAAIVSGSVTAVAPRFSAREAAVLSYLAEGLSLADVAAEVHLSVNTVKTHVKAIYRKLGVNSRPDAVRTWRSSLSSTSDD